MNSWKDLQPVIEAFVDASKSDTNNNKLDFQLNKILSKAKPLLRKEAKILQAIQKLPKMTGVIDIFISYCSSDIQKVLIKGTYKPQKANFHTFLDNTTFKKIPGKIYREFFGKPDNHDKPPVIISLNKLKEDTGYEVIDPDNVDMDNMENPIIEGLSLEFKEEDSILWSNNFLSKKTNPKVPGIKWELDLFDIAVLNISFARKLLKNWEKGLNEQHDVDLSADFTRLKKLISSPEKCLAKKMAFAKGSRGQIDIKALQKLANSSFGEEVYDRRRKWKIPRKEN